MKILIVRHADPDYSVDSLTKKGWREAEYLAERLSKLKVKDFFVSPLGRAKDTASLTLKKMQRTAKEYPWLREFAPTIIRPDVAWQVRQQQQKPYHARQQLSRGQRQVRLFVVLPPSSPLFFHQDRQNARNELVSVQSPAARHPPACGYWHLPTVPYWQ